MTPPPVPPTQVLTVHRKELVADGVVVLDLRSPVSEPLPAWTAGAHIDLYCGDLTDTVIRQYSLCGDPADRGTYRIAVRREEQGRGSSHVHDVLAPGSRVTVGGPRNHFPLVDADRYLFVAGGIGITPILPMLRAAQATGADWQLVYGGRSRAAMPFCEELLARSPKRVSLVPQDERGPIDLDGLSTDPGPGTAVYCCGPEGLLLALEEHAAAWTTTTLHLERFAPKTIESGPDTGFEIELRSTGEVLVVPPGVSALKVLVDAGQPVFYACEEGTCASCGTSVVDGEVDHRDSLQSPEEQQRNDLMYVCVSRARSRRLVLDL